MEVMRKLFVLWVALLGGGALVASTAASSAARSAHTLQQQVLVTDTAAHDPHSVPLPDISELPPADLQKYQAATSLSRGVLKNPGDWAAQARVLVKRNRFAEAADAFRNASRLYYSQTRANPGAGLAMRTMAERYETEVTIYRRSEAAPRVADTHRRLEPRSGAYLGAFIDREAQISDGFMDGSRPHKNANRFNRLVGRPHAAILTYNGYPSPLPNTWFRHLAGQNLAAQWSIEPGKLETLMDEAPLRQLARAAAAANIPIFVRFASEMNGPWTPYYGNPKLYRDRFQTVAKIFHELAPNVAMVWCPANMPENNIRDYYPGEKAVDWVGVNFYSTYFEEAPPHRQITWRNPADNIRFIYNTYADKHPIMIGEWAATHRSRLDNVERADFAGDKITELYASLPRKFPRVKAVFWFSMDATRYASDPSRRLNDYSLLNNPAVTAKYRQAVASPYFLSNISLEKSAAAPVQFIPLQGEESLTGKVPLSVWVKTYDEHPTIIYRVNGSLYKQFRGPGTGEVTLDTDTLPPGPVRLSVEVRDSTGRLAGEKSVLLRR